MEVLLYIFIVRNGGLYTNKISVQLLQIRNLLSWVEHEIYSVRNFGSSSVL